MASDGNFEGLGDFREDAVVVPKDMTRAYSVFPWIDQLSGEVRFHVAGSSPGAEVPVVNREWRRLDEVALHRLK